MKKCLLAIMAIFFVFSSNTFAQDLNKTWQFESVQNSEGNPLFSINKNEDFLELKDGEFSYALEAKNNLRASGDYIHQNNLLVFYYNQPNDTIRRYKIKVHTDSTLVFSENGIDYRFMASKQMLENTMITSNTTTDRIIDSQGFSLQSLWRGIIGMITLIILAFLFSNNRKAINWKTAGIGIAFQLIIAIGVLKVDFIKTGFEMVGQGFIAILGHTQAGSEFLFGDMLDVTSFGFIFAFQVLPTIIFFSALTSVLFYLGIKVCI